MTMTHGKACRGPQMSSRRSGDRLTKEEFTELSVPWVDWLTKNGFNYLGMNAQRSLPYPQDRVPAALVAALGLARQSAGGVVLADGSVRQLAIYAVEVDCDGVWRPVLVSAVSDEVWLGMWFMANHKLRIAVVPGGAVALTPLP